MNRIRLTIFMFAIALFAISCGSSSKNSESSTETKTENTTSVETKYENDWETFKKAVVNKDIPGMGAFASSDAVDSEMLLTILSDADFLQILKNTKYKDLKEVTNDGGKFLEFNASIKGTDGEYEYESSISIYFSKAEDGLKLDYYLAAG